MTRCLSALLLCLAGAGVAAELPAPLAQALKASGFPAASVGIVVQEAGSATPVIAHSAERALNPASTIKLLTTYAALELLGPAYTWPTEIYASGELQGDVLAGNLIIKGYGDPKLTMGSLWLMLRNLRARGVREIRGDLVLDHSYFAVSDADPARFDNEPNRPYNTPPDALLVNFKAVQLTFVPNPERNSVTIVPEPNHPLLTIANNITLDRAPCDDWLARLKVDMIPDEDTARIGFSGPYSAQCGEKQRSYNMLGHRQYTGGLFRQFWKELGGTLNGNVRDGEVPRGARLLLSNASPTLSETVRDINKFSNNVMARQLYLTLGAESAGAPATTDKAERAIRQWLSDKALALPGLVLENGAGLSRSERISARGMADLLLAAHASPVMPELIASLPLVAVDGTMKRRLKNGEIAGRGHLKGGTLSNARAIAGYVLDRRGRMMIVVCIVNDARAAVAGAALQDALLQWVHARGS